MREESFFASARGLHLRWGLPKKVKAKAMRGFAEMKNKK